MRRTVPHLLVVALAAGCGGAEAFLQDFAAAECALYEECGYLSYLGVEDAAGCEEVVSSTPCDAYDAGAGDACLEGLDDLTCDAYAAGSWPAACDAACGAAE